MVSTKDAFLSEIYRFCEVFNMSKTAFGRKFGRSPNYVFELEEGRQPKAASMDRVDAAMVCYAEDMKDVGV